MADKERTISMCAIDLVRLASLNIDALPVSNEHFMLPPSGITAAKAHDESTGVEAMITIGPISGIQVVFQRVDLVRAAQGSTPALSSIKA